MTTPQARLDRVVLSDGVQLDDLVDPESRTVSARVLMDPEIFALEQERIWGATWVFLAHASEIREPGDYVLRQMGSDTVIVTRDGDGSVHVLLNVCSHRAAEVCHAEQGSARQFQCPYHGWSYDRAGRLVGAPVEAKMYRDGLDRSKLGLRAARVATRQGLIFARWGEGPSLQESLGDFGFYLDLYLGMTEAGFEVAGPPQRWRIPVNWKIPAENFSGDAYHALVTHRSEELAGRVGRGTMLKSQIGVAVSDPVRGHGGRCHRLRDEPATDAAGVSRILSQVLPSVPESTHAQIEDQLTADQFELVRSGAIPFLGSVFPNLAFLSVTFPRERGGPPEPGITIRTWVPTGPNEIEFISWALVHADADEDLRARGRRVIAYSFGSGGTLEQDDAEAWSQIQRGVQGVRGREQRIHYDSTAEVSNVDEDSGRKWVGPGEVRMGFGSDDNQWNWWRRWLAQMSGSEEVGS